MNNNDNLLEEIQAIHDKSPERYKRCQNCKYLIDNYKCKKLKVPFFDIAICPTTKENEELKENIEILQNQIIQEHEQYNNLIHDSIDDLKLIRKYEQENEAYKLSENEAKEIIAELEYKNKDYLKQLDALKPENVYLHKTIKKYEQTLKEIREISEPVKKDICNNCGWQDSDGCEPEGCACNEFITILHKINEVLNDRN